MKYLASRYEKAFYIDSRAESSNVISNSFLILDIKGKLSAGLMQQAIAHGFSHPCFHFRYTLQGEQLYKEHIHHAFEIPHIDLSQQSTPEHAFQCLLEEYYQKKLVFDQGTLFKGCLCKIAPDRFKAIIMVHHICLDGTGFQLFFNQIKQAYQALRQGVTCLPVMEHLPFVQAPALSDALKDEAFHLWEKSLDGHAARSDFNQAINPGKRRATSESLSLGEPLSQRVKSFCRRQGLTPNLLFKGLYALLVGRMANQQVVTVCSPMDRRTKQMKQQIGCFVNTRLDVFDLNQAETLDQYWLQIKKFSKGSKPYAELPYIELVQHLKQQNENPEAMLSNVAFGSTIGIDEQVLFDEGCLIHQDYGFIELNADLQLLFCESSSNSFNFRFDYLQSFQESGLFTHFLDRFRQRLEWVLAEHNAALVQIPLLSEQERLQLKRFNQQIQPYPDQTLAQLVHLWVQKTPTATALIESENNDTLSYRQLHERVSDLAHYLAQLEPLSGEGQPCVVINLDSLVDTVIAILATQYRGLAFTCVDASAPVARKQTVMAQIAPLLLIGDSIPSEQGSHCHHLSSLAALPKSPCLAEPVGVAAHYISQYIFTSGTTGQPKAVALSQRALVSTLYNSRAIPVGQRLLYSANEAFDAASLQLWLALIHGRILIVPGRNDIVDPEAMARLLHTYRVDHLFLTTGLFETYMSSSRREMFNNVDTMVFGGDSVSKQAVARGLECHIKNLINIYGPTETSIYVTAHHCTESDLAASSIPVGKPRQNSCTWIVDDRDRLLGIGMVGHIVISGDGLAEGYAGQPLQNEKFCQIHFAEFGSEPAQRIYRTGDYGYWREDGALIFCGRRDDQIKLRGYRIESGEIRQALEQIAGVEMACVVLSKKAKNKQLVGYYQAEQALDHTYMYQQLQQHLPGYMLPSRLIHLEAFPLNRNGKLDRRALPEPEFTSGESEALTPLQQMLLRQAAKVLELPSLALKDDFVSQGGDSISAIILSVELEEQGIRLSTADIMKYRCFADMVQRLSAVEKVAIIAGEKQGRFDLLPAQRWFFEQNFAVPSHFNQAVTLRLPEGIDHTRMVSALSYLTQYHDSFWLRFDGMNQQFFSSPAQCHFGLHVLSAINWKDAGHHIAALNAAFDLHHGPLLKVLLFSIDGEISPYLYLCAHHLIVDGVSWRRIVADLKGYYEQGDEFKPAPYSNTQCYRTQWETFRSDPPELDYWLSQAARVIPARDQQQQKTVQRRQIIVSPQQTQALFGDANRPYKTQGNELLVSVLYRLFNHPDSGLTLLLEGHGRKTFAETIRSEATVGWFTSIFPVHLPANTGEWAVIIRQTKQTLRTLPGKGENFLSIAYNHPDPVIRRNLQALLQIPISFNFLGRFGHGDEEGWHIEQRFNQYLVSELNKPLRGLDINAWVSHDRLYIDVEMAGDEIAGMTLEQICGHFNASLEALLAHCCAPHCPGGLTPCDLADITLEQKMIENLEQRVGPLDNIYPATEFQRELLYFNRVNPDYQIDQLFFKLEGELDRQAFTHAWAKALARYDMLRAGFDDTFTPGQPLALISNHVALPLQYVNWEGSDSERLLQQSIVSERQRPFDWHQPPLLRLMLARISTNNHLLLLTFHHVLFDGWSMQIFLKEIMVDYERLVKGSDLSLPQYSFAAFPRWLTAQDSKPATRYWQQYLAGSRMNMRITPDCNNSGSNALRIHAVKGELGREKSERLRNLAIDTGATLNQLCQLAWAVTLANYSNGHDVVFGTTLTKRPVEINKVTELVGLFVATPPLRVKLEGTLTDLVKQLNDDNEQRVEHAFCDLNHYDEQWRPTAPFGTLFVFENYPEPKARNNHSLTYHHLGTVSGTNHQIVLCQFPGDALQFSLFYDSTELSSGLASRIADEYRNVLLNLPLVKQVEELLTCH